MTLGAIVLGVLSMVPETGHATGRADGARREATVAAVKSRAAAPRDASVATRSAGCNEALDALAICKLPVTTTARRSSGDGAAPERRALDAAPQPPAPKAIADVASAPVEAPARLLPVFALGLAIAGALLALFGFRAIASTAGRQDAVGRSTLRSFGFLKKSATAAIAKERLLHYRTVPQ